MAEEQVATEVAIHGDVLETIFSYVPLIYLLPANTVSKAWNAAVFSSLRRFNKPKPWLIVHTQSIRASHATTTFAYDPRSNIWLHIHQKLATRHESALHSSDSQLLYTLTPSKFSFSIDPFHLTWHHANPPAVWRTDPIVTVVGHRIIVAGGACDFEDDPLAVEIYDINARTWERSESMPATLKDSAASTWLSVAADTKTIFMMEQMSGVAHSFNPDSKIWSGPFDLRPDRSIYFSVIRFHGDSLIMVGLLGDSENINGVKAWELSGESLEFCKEIGVMPKELVEKLKGEGTSFSSIRVSSKADFFYIYNPGEPGELVVLEVGGEGLCRWGILRNAAVNDGSRVAERLVVTCSDVGLGDIGKVVGSGNGIFTILKC
ncbi:F-box/kelch-repeat protein At1g23390-like [Durio zibethinus]|uniref:F-box/kelch-repeat protein At1g23390-like n=1 Tax=Durio zibethinus TaxID=66656 RepID=A0A6P5Y2V8_DURZI|nr:F-box/kelch-repeat protein At1g23390-like [Durio zibethinus]